MSTETITAADSVATTEGATGAPTVVSGKATLYMTTSYVIQALARDTLITPVNPWAHSVEGDITATTWQITGGDIDLRNGTGFLNADGGIVVTNMKSGQSMVFLDIKFNLANHTLDFVWKTADGDAAVNALDVAPGQGGIWGSSGSYTSKEVHMNRDSAEFVNDFLKFTGFEDEGLFGALAVTFELKEAAPTAGVVEWGKK